MLTNLLEPEKVSSDGPPALQMQQHAQEFDNLIEQ